MPENEQNPRDVPLADAEDPNMPPVEVEVADIPPVPADVLEKILDALEDHADTTQYEEYLSPYPSRANTKCSQEHSRGCSEC